MMHLRLKWRSSIFPMQCRGLYENWYQLQRGFVNTRWNIQKTFQAKCLCVDHIQYLLSKNLTLFINKIPNMNFKVTIWSTQLVNVIVHIFIVIGLRMAIDFLYNTFYAREEELLDAACDVLNVLTSAPLVNLTALSLKPM